MRTRLAQEESILVGLSDDVDRSLVRYSVFWIRVVAFTIDLIIFSAVSFLLALFGLEEEFLKVLTIIAAWLYYSLQESSVAQATIGKRICGIVVMDLDGERISFLRATLRHLSKLFSWIFFIGYIMVVFTKQKRGLHDFIAGTLVTYR